MLTLRRPLRRKVRMRWFFDISKVTQSSFFKLNLTDPPLDFWCASFGKHQFKPFSFHFPMDFYIKIIFEFGRVKLIRPIEIEEKKTMFNHTNQPLITSFYIKKVPILPI